MHKFMRTVGFSKYQKKKDMEELLRQLAAQAVRTGKLAEKEGSMFCELRAELEAKAARLGIAQDVKFLGVQSDTSVWYQAMDVFVMPSLFEGLPVVGMEAQASGLPCVFSTGVTEEVLLRPDSCRISLEQPDEAWAAVLKDADRNLPDRAQAAVQSRQRWLPHESSPGRSCSGFVLLRQRRCCSPSQYRSLPPILM